jgi:dTMP kinase
MTGKFITFEGLDAVGKSTQIAWLCHWLAANGHDPVRTMEPGGTAIGQELRRLLLSQESLAMAPTTELLLYEADRAQHVEEVIRPALQAGRIVISDRFADSTTAYQGFGRGLDMDLVLALHRLATGGLTPDLTFFLDMDPELAMARKRAGQLALLDRMEDQEEAFRRRVRDGYLQIARDNPDRVRVLNGTLPVHQIHKQVVAAVVPLLTSPERTPGRGA